MSECPWITSRNPLLHPYIHSLEKGEKAVACVANCACMAALDSVLEFCQEVPTDREHIQEPRCQLCPLPPASTLPIVQHVSREMLPCFQYTRRGSTVDLNDMFMV
jgi:hypothetical protein